MVAIGAAAPAAAKLKGHLLPRVFREDLAQLAHKRKHVFEGKPELKPIAVRFFKALLQPYRRAGRPCDQRITTASRLFRRYRRRYPDEPYSMTWNRIYGVAIPGVDDLPPSEASTAKRKLRDAVRSRRTARRRRSKAKQ